MEIQKEPITSYCSACWKDRIITTNGKCRVCGTDILKRHWKTSIKKLEIILSKPTKTPLEIKGVLYLIPEKELIRFSTFTDYAEKIGFIEHVKKDCKSYKI